MATSHLKKYVTRKQAAERLACSYKHIYRLDRKGLLKRHVLAGSTRPRYLLSDVLELMED